MESLEDRRLLAANLSIIDFSINGSSVAIGDLTTGTGNALAETAGANQLVVSIEVDDTATPGIALGDDLTADVNLQLSISSIVSTGSVLGDISVIGSGGSPALTFLISLTVAANAT